MKKIILSTQVIFTLFYCLPIFSQSIVRGPYLQQGTPNSIVIQWRTSSTQNAQVNYGTDPLNLNQTASNSTTSRDHQVQLTGLSPNTEYYYQIGSSGSMFPMNNNQHFITSPPHGTAQPIRVWVLGDCGTKGSSQRSVRDAYYQYTGSTHTDMMLFLGDNAYDDGSDSEYQLALFENMYEDQLAQTVAWSCTGNHDLGYGNSAVYYSIFTHPKNGEAGGVPSGTEEYFSFDYGNVHFISLESMYASKSTTGPMATWLVNDLSNTVQPWIVALWHHPPYSDGHDSDSEGSLVQMRENIVPILEQYGVDLVLNGHSHRYERTPLIKGHYGHSSTWNPSTMAVDNGWGKEDVDNAYMKKLTGPASGDGAVYLTAGNAGKRDGATSGKPVHKYVYGGLGSGVLDINGNRLDFKMLDNNGSIRDYFTIIKDDLATKPTANFIADKTAICPGESVQFTDNSYGGPTLWSWTFEGQSSVTSTDQNPIVTYNTPGIYDVTLVATNAEGSDTIIKNDFIVVTGNANVPVSEGFSNAFPPVGWSVNNPDNGLQWEQRVDYGNPAPSMIMNNADNSFTGEVDEIITEPYDFSSAVNPVLAFDVAYTKYDADSPDELRIFASTNCGISWNELWMKTHTDLETFNEPDPLLSNNWVPTLSSHWRNELIDLSSYVGQSSVQFKFHNTSGYGTRIWVDNVNLSSGLNIEKIEEIKFSIYPNPSNGEFSVVTSNALIGGWYNIYDNMGKLVHTSLITRNITTINLPHLNKGVYVIKATNESIKKKQIIVLE